MARSIAASPAPQIITGSRRALAVAGVYAALLLLACGPEQAPTGIIHEPGERERALAEIQAEEKGRLAHERREAERRRAEKDAEQDALDQEEMELRRRAQEREQEEAKERQAAAEAAARAQEDARRAAEDARQAEERKVEAAEKAAACAAARRRKCNADCQGNEGCVKKCVKNAPCQ